MNFEMTNFQKVLDKTIEENEKANRVPTLLLHSCCAPCSSYVLEMLSNYFKITIVYYNPNIYPEKEYKKRLDNKTLQCEYLHIHEWKELIDVLEQLA